MFKLNISTEVFVVYIDTGSLVLYIPSKSRDLADENKTNLTEWKWFLKQPYCNTMKCIIVF